jgi:hypothetical protein
MTVEIRNENEIFESSTKPIENIQQFHENEVG